MQATQAFEISAEAQQAKLRLGIVGNTPALIEAIQRAIKVAPIDLSVLITGESGTGKEFFPQIIHQFSARKHSKYIAVNCGAIPEGTIDSELFGHEKGSFTGAVAARKGYFEEADGGTIFLDEVAELPLTTQARLLRVLETGEFLKVGSSSVQKTNIRIVAATNVDMLQAVAEGRFREDLYYRLSTVQISIPPLRDRGNDIMLLARKFASDFAEKYRMPQISFDEGARRLLLSYRWPGNVRQLKNAVEQAALFSAGMEVNHDMLASYLPPDAPKNAQSYSPALRNNAYSYEREREMLFNLIFRLQKELDELKRKIDERETEHKHITPTIDAGGHPFAAADHIRADLPSSLVKVEHNTNIKPLDHAPIIDVDAHEMATTLEENEKEMIRQALLRNDGKRKTAAQELNISERTLYRKIKEYGLDL